MEPQYGIFFKSSPGDSDVWPELRTAGINKRRNDQMNECLFDLQKNSLQDFFLKHIPRVHFQCNSILRNLIYTQYCQDSLFCKARNICIIYQKKFFLWIWEYSVSPFRSWRLEQKKKKKKLYHFLYSENCFLPLWHLETISQQY